MKAFSPKAMPTLKQKTISGLTWSFVDNFSQTGITFVISIVLARLIPPSEFGLIGLTGIFFAISMSFINSGFGTALVQKKACTNVDYSTVFYFNLAVGFLFYWILFFSAPAISRFFNEPQLIQIMQVLSIILVIDSLTIIQRTILIKQINFKLQTKISIVASIVSGIVGIIMAYRGFGVWSLVTRQICMQALNSSLLWIWNGWRPLLVFSKQSFSELFSFGYKLLLSGLIDTIFQNIYLMIIGRFYSAQELGFYTRAKHFQALPSENFTNIIGRVSFPVLVQMKDDKIALKRNYRILIKSTMFITFVSMMGMAAVAESMIIVLIGEPWRQSIIYLQMLCFVGMMFPLHALNLGMLTVQGRSDLFLGLEIIKKFLVVPVVIIGIFLGIKAMIAGMIVTTQLAYFINSYWSGRLIGYSMKDQVIDILPSFLLAVTMGFLVLSVGWMLPFGNFFTLVIQVITGATIVLIISEMLKVDAYLYIKQILLSKIKDNMNNHE